MSESIEQQNHKFISNNSYELHWIEFTVINFFLLIKMYFVLTRMFQLLKKWRVYFEFGDFFQKLLNVSPWLELRMLSFSEPTLYNNRLPQ